ncbi:MAG: YdcF family protein [Armatimonadota bacterium]
MAARDKKATDIDEMLAAERSEDGEPSPAPPKHRRWLKFFFLLFSFALLSFAGFGCFLDVYGQVDQAQPAQVIVILGARVTPLGEPGDSLRARTLHAVDLYHKGFAKKVLCTGGLGDYPPSEAEAAAQMAMAHGVPGADIIQENESTSTTENVRNTAEICRQQGWTRVIAVSDPYHLWRVKRRFALEGITAYPSPALKCERNRITSLRIQWTARETLAVLRDMAERR